MRLNSRGFPVRSRAFRGCLPVARRAARETTVGAMTRLPHAISTHPPRRARAASVSSPFPFRVHSWPPPRTSPSATRTRSRGHSGRKHRVAIGSSRASQGGHRPTAGIGSIPCGDPESAGPAGASCGRPHREPSPCPITGTAMIESPRAALTCGPRHRSGPVRDMRASSTALIDAPRVGNPTDSIT